jgi:hypothetical protein
VKTTTIKGKKQVRASPETPKLGESLYKWDKASKLDMNIECIIFSSTLKQCDRENFSFCEDCLHG